MYVYIMSEPGLYTVGFYDPSGNWHADRDFEKQEDAATRVSYLNGAASADEYLSAAKKFFDGNEKGRQLPVADTAALIALVEVEKRQTVALEQIGVTLNNIWETLVTESSLATAMRLYKIE